MAENQSEIISRAMKLVVPMRHEFGLRVNVMNLINDSTYAESVFQMASGSGNERLREEARYLQRMIFGPREGPGVPGATGARPPAAPSPLDQSARDQALADRAAKYTRGLR